MKDKVWNAFGIPCYPQRREQHGPGTHFFLIRAFWGWGKGPRVFRHENFCSKNGGRIDVFLCLFRFLRGRGTLISRKEMCGENAGEGCALRLRYFSLLSLLLFLATTFPNPAAILFNASCLFSGTPDRTAAAEQTFFLFLLRGVTFLLFSARREREYHEASSVSKFKVCMGFSSFLKAG